MTTRTEQTPQHTPPRDQVALDWQRILHAANEDLQTTWGFANDGDPAMQAEADDLEAALDRSGLEIERRVYSHAALVEALEGLCFSASMRYGVSDGNDQEAYEDAEKRHGPALASRYLTARRTLAAAKGAR